MRAGGAEMKRNWITLVVIGLVALSTASLAFEEQKLPPVKSGGHGATPGDGAGAGPSAAIVDPGIRVPRVETGTKIRVPGLGVIGEIPRMDFGLELLYGASQPKGSDVERNEGNGVMGRVTVPLKSSR